VPNITSNLLALLSRIGALTKLFSAKKPQKTISNLLALLRRISALTKLFSAKKPQKTISNLLKMN
jgi:hypothetical protein